MVGGTKASILRLTVHVLFRDLVCVAIIRSPNDRTLRSLAPTPRGQAPALGASCVQKQNLQQIARALFDLARWHRSRVPRVLPEHRGAYAVRGAAAPLHPGAGPCTLERPETAWTLLRLREAADSIVHPSHYVSIGVSTGAATERNDPTS